MSKLKLPGATVDPVIPESRGRRDIRNLEKNYHFWIPDLGFASSGMTISATSEPHNINCLLVPSVVSGLPAALRLLAAPHPGCLAQFTSYHHQVHFQLRLISLLWPDSKSPDAHLFWCRLNMVEVGYQPVQ